MATKPVLVENKAEDRYCKRCEEKYYSFQAEKHATVDLCFANLRAELEGHKRAYHEADATRSLLTSIFDRIQEAKFSTNPVKQ